MGHEQSYSWTEFVQIIFHTQIRQQHECISSNDNHFELQFRVNRTDLQVIGSLQTLIDRYLHANSHHHPAQQQAVNTILFTERKGYLMTERFLEEKKHLTDVLAVSYTHLDVYKRQIAYRTTNSIKKHISNTTQTQTNITKQVYIN